MKSSAEFLASVPALLRPGMHRILRILLEAFIAAQVSQRDPWEFAVGIAELRAAGATDAALRLLACNGFVEQALEKTKPGDRERQFARIDGVLLSGCSCFTLTEAGMDAAPMLQAEVIAPSPETPYWDDMNHTVLWGSVVVKRFRCEAPYQEAVLRTFQANQWRRCVRVVLPDDPGVSAKARLHDTIKNLNRSVRPLLRFCQEGCGTRVTWRSDDGATAPQCYP